MSRNLGPPFASHNLGPPPVSSDLGVALNCGTPCIKIKKTVKCLNGVYGVRVPALVLEYELSLHILKMYHHRIVHERKKRPRVKMPKCTLFFFIGV